MQSISTLYSWTHWRLLFQLTAMMGTTDVHHNAIYVWLLLSTISLKGKLCVALPAIEKRSPSTIRYATRKWDLLHHCMMHNHIAWFYFHRVTVAILYPSATRRPDRFLLWTHLQTRCFSDSMPWSIRRTVRHATPAMYLAVLVLPGS